MTRYGDLEEANFFAQSTDLAKVIIEQLIKCSANLFSQKYFYYRTYLLSQLIHL